MAAGYLDLLQRELRKAVVHVFADEATLDLTPGIQGQIASVTATGSFYIFTGGLWKRILNEDDLALLNTALTTGAQVRVINIVNLSAGSLAFPHDLTGFPQIEVTAGPLNALVTVEVEHDGVGTSTLKWKGAIAGPATATAIGLPPVTVLAGAGGARGGRR